MDALDALGADPGTMRIGGRVFVVAPPTPGDMMRVAKRMRDMARAAVCVPPLVSVAALRDQLPPDVFAQAVREAVALGAAGGAEPELAAVREQYAELAGVRWQVWYFLAKTDPAVTPESVAGWVTEDTLFAVTDALNAALGLGGEKKASPPPTATN